MNEKLRNRLIILAILFLLVIFFFTLDKENTVFVKDNKDIKIIKQNEIKKTNTIIFEPEKDEKRITLKSINQKYEVSKKNEVNVCTKTGYTSLVQKNKDYNVVLVENGNTFSYYKEKNQNCSLIGRIKNVRFTDNTVETYANDSIYSSYESMDDFKVFGLVRIIQNNVKSFDSSSVRYTNPTAFKKGVLMVENNRDIIAYDSHDKIIFKQDNSKNIRKIYAINLVNESLFVIVKEKSKLYIESYNINDTQSITEKKPNLKVEIEDFLGEYDKEITTKASAEYGVFAANGKTIIVSSSFSQLFVLDNTDTIIDIDGNLAFLKSDDRYYIVDLSKKEYEDIGVIKVMNYQSKEKSAYFSVQDDKGEEQYIKFKVR